MNNVASFADAVEARVRRQDNVIQIGNVLLDARLPVHALHSMELNEDETIVDTGDLECLTIRQVDEEGHAHVTCLSPGMVAALAKLLDGYMILQGTYDPNSVSKR